MTPARRHLATALVTAAAATLAGCSSSDAAPEAGGSSSATVSESSTATAPTVPPFTFTQDPQDDACSQTKKDREIAWHGSPITITADGSITGIVATNSPGATLRERDAMQVPLVGDQGASTVGGVSDWPLTSRDVNRFVLLDQDEDLVGTPLEAGTQVLPVLHLLVTPDSSASSFVFDYELSNGQERQVTYDVGLRFPRKSC